MSRKKDQIGISYPRMTLIGILEFEKGTKLEYSDPNWNSWGWKVDGERAVYTLNALMRHCVVVLCNL